MGPKVDIESIEARVKAATPGPWVAREFNDPQWGVFGSRHKLHAIVLTSQGHDEPNAEFIAHAREDVPALIARVRELEGVLAEALEFVGDGEWEFGDGRPVNTKRWREVAGGSNVQR